MLIGCAPYETTLFDAVTLAVFLAPLSVGLFTAPACAAVSWVMLRRFAAPLERGALEQCIVVGVSLAGACTAVLYADGFAAAGWGGRRDAIQAGEALLVFIAPAPLGAIPWAAGELVCGESERQGLALFSSIAMAYALSLAAFALIGPEAFWVPWPAAFVTQLASAALAVLCAAETYLMTRGRAVEPAPPEAIALERVLSDYSSSISEKRSLRGCSSGFF
jgi:hypothetical protein